MTLIYRILFLVLFKMVVLTVAPTQAMPVEGSFGSAIWTLTGYIDTAIGYTDDPAYPFQIGDAVSASVSFDLYSVFQQCSPCEYTGDRIWRGYVTAFSMNIAGNSLAFDLSTAHPGYVSVSPGDDPTESDSAIIALGSYAVTQNLIDATLNELPYEAYFSLGIHDSFGEMFATHDWLKIGRPSTSSSTKIEFGLAVPTFVDIFRSTFVRYEIEPVSLSYEIVRQPVSTPSTLSLVLILFIGTLSSRVSRG